MYYEIFYILGDFLYGNINLSGYELMTCTLLSSCFTVFIAIIPFIVCFFLLRWVCSLLFSGR